MFYVDFGGSRPTGSDVTSGKSSADLQRQMNPDHVGGYQVAIPMINGIESKFGLSLPRFSSTLQLKASAKS
jgi:solute carrier family 25 (mitochondrial aspartate/glutamate transporter), member 12/13